ncbi:hypothetical protein FGSG_10371 [Fusarium graminearum PH-1]|uniref:Chromosome 1, complete genome n=2 Tax=Gibberella zeae TaxID=5518 RepID=I1S0X9_GIBZE|nr:hypothetical protein FGSG_10371 [Fusarium graminearum PH-1]ESU17078.1 hypothetical protein FGSG_10371 [Fusarium graminearum PH-1]CEF75772.1 unnamed protein product [Fusarium graminearum]|eukprot:XP_011319340.1 hypothetical protein FGSG_10371 [Fusarium graminearum PH-1]
MWWSHSHIRKRASMAAMEVPLESERDDYITHDYDMGDLERESTMDENAAVEGPSTKTSTFSCCPTVQLCLIYVDGKDVIFFDLLPPASFDSAFNGIVILPPIQQLVSDHRFNGVLNGLHVQVRGRKHGCVAIYAATDNKPSKVRWQKLRFSGRVVESVRAIFNSVFWDAGGSVSALHRHGTTIYPFLELAMVPRVTSGLQQKLQQFPVPQRRRCFNDKAISKTFETPHLVQHMGWLWVRLVYIQQLKAIFLHMPDIIANEHSFNPEAGVYQCCRHRRVLGFRGAKGRFNQYEIGNLAGVNCIMLCTVLWSPDEVSYSLGSDAYPHRLRLSNIYPCPFRRLMVHWKISTVVTLMVLAIGHRQNRTHHLPKPQGGHNNTGITKRARQ